DRASVSGRIVAVGGWAAGNQFRTSYSDDGGATWSSLATHQFTDEVRYLGGSPWIGGNRMNAAYVSTDDGVTWGSVSIGGGPNAFLNGISARGGGVVVVGDASSVYRSTTAGANWTSIAPAHPAYAAVVSFDAQRIAIVAS